MLANLRPRKQAERWSTPTASPNSDLGWAEPFSQRFHKLSKSALDDIIHTLLLVPVQHGEMTEWTITDGQMQRLCAQARRQFLREESLLQLNAGTVVVGDLHGDFRDLRRIFTAFGHPSKHSVNYLFLGDYVDRGVNGLNVVALLFAYKLRFPDKVYLVRGNHESVMLTLMHGFYAECVAKSSRETWRRVCNVFDCLPLAAVIADQLFCVHGGISPELERPENVLGIARPCKIPSRGHSLLSDMVWSDPSSNATGWEPNRRGAGYYFGMEEASKFLEANGLRAIVRSHEMVQEGWRVENAEEGKVITVFSAADYRGHGNDSAVLVARDDMSCFIRLLPSLDPKEEAIIDSVDWNNPRLDKIMQAALAAELAAAEQKETTGVTSIGTVYSVSSVATRSIDSTHSSQSDGSTGRSALRRLPTDIVVLPPPLGTVQEDAKQPSKPIWTDFKSINDPPQAVAAAN